MASRYELITYSDQDKKILDNTTLTNDDIKLVNDLKIEFQDKNFSSAIEDFYKFYKNNYLTSDLAEIFKVSSRQIQRIFKALGINRDKLEAQQIILSNKDNAEIKKTSRKVILERLTDTQISGPSLEQYIRHEIDLLLGELLPHCEIIVGITSVNVTSSESDIPIIIINNNSLYKYIIKVDGTSYYNPESRKKSAKAIESKVFYRGYTLFRINIKTYFTSGDNASVKYENEIKNKLVEIVDLISSEVTQNTSFVKLE